MMRRDRDSYRREREFRKNYDHPISRMDYSAAMRSIALAAVALSASLLFESAPFNSCWAAAPADRGPLRSRSAPLAAADARAVAAIRAHAYRHGVRLDVRLPVLPAGAADPDTVAGGLYLRYAKAVAFGQLSAAEVRIPSDMPRTGFDPGAALARLRTGGLDEALASLPPPHPAYHHLVEALARYRGIADRGGWPGVPNGPLIVLGSQGVRVSLLRRRLAAEGASRDSAADGRVFDERLEKSVIEFQRRHGLAPDGRVGPKTLATLNVPVQARIAQIIANLERWRWVPRDLPLPRVEVNTAAAELGVVEAGGEALRMRVVVGSPRHPTPLLQSEIRAVVVNPPWNVPASIWRNEIRPRLRRDPTYLAANEMRILGREQDPHGLEIDWRREDGGLAALRIQQRPGPWNALGRVKFDMPNRFTVYLHDTPARAVFKKPDRALSHGCVRLEEPEALLAYLFRSRGDPPPLPAEGDAGPRATRAVPAPKPLPVYLLHWTAFVSTGGAVHFREDLYGYDARITTRLSRPQMADEVAALAGGCRVDA